MKFSEKLQKMRKENKLSQEQLADQLEVSRQAVSKWESGQTYPEMDKLLALCKIFKCSLDELTNDEIVEIKGTEKGKLTASNLLDEVFEIVNKSISMFKKMSIENIIGCIFTMILVVLGLLLLKLPVHYFYELGEGLFMNFGTSAGTILSAFWNFILSVSYLIFAFVLFFYIYKVLFLEKWENVVEKSRKHSEVKKNLSLEETIKIDTVEVSSEEKLKPEDSEHLNIHYVPPRHGDASAIFKGFSKVVSFCVKVFVAMISIPFLFFFFAMVMALVIGIFLLLKGVFYIGIILLLLSGICLGYIAIELVFNFLFNRKSSAKKNFILFIISLFGLGIGAGITAIDITSTKYIDTYPKDYERKEISREFTMGEDFLIFNSNYYNNYNYYGIRYEIDSSLDKIRVTAKYCSEIYDVKIDLLENNQAYIQKKEVVPFTLSAFWDTMIRDLSKKEVYNYSLLSEVEVIVSGNKEDIEQLKKNQQKVEEESWRQHQEERENLSREEINRLQEEIQKLMEEKQNLEENSFEKERLLEEYKQKIQDYKDQLSNLLEQ